MTDAGWRLMFNMDSTFGLPIGAGWVVEGKRWMMSKSWGQELSDSRASRCWSLDCVRCISPSSLWVGDAKRRQQLGWLARCGRAGVVAGVA